MINSIKTSAWVNFKGLRFSIINYLMLVIIFPCSYLVISLVSGLGTSPENYVLGLFCSMQYSLFLNLQSVMIANSNHISVIEQYATFKVRALNVHLGSSLFHGMLCLPLLFIMIVIGFLKSGILSLTLIPVWILSILFLSFLSMVLGGLINNPNIATPLLSMLYMIIIMITPFYANLDQLSNFAKILYIINPFAHSLSLYSAAMNMPTFCNPILSVLVLLILCIILGFLSKKRWYSNKAVERLGVF